MRFSLAACGKVLPATSFATSHHEYLNLYISLAVYDLLSSNLFTQPDSLVFNSCRIYLTLDFTGLQLPWISAMSH